MLVIALVPAVFMLAGCGEHSHSEPAPSQPDAPLDPDAPSNPDAEL